MDKLKKIFLKKNREPEVIENVSEVKDISFEDKFLKESQKATEILNKSILNGSFSQLPAQISKIATETTEIEYVFKYERRYIDKVVSAIGILINLVCLYFIFVLIGTLIYSKDFIILSILGIIASVVIFILNILVVRKSVSISHFYKRYDLYYEDLRYKDIELIGDLADYSKIPVAQVIKDLNIAIDLKLIPQGHFGTDNLILIVSNEMYEKYKKQQASYDRYYKKKAEERLRMGERTEEIQALLDQGQEYIEKIHQSNDIIKDKEISDKLDKMEKIVSMIFYELDLSPQYADKLGMFMNYYLPTTKKLLDSYIEIDEKEVKGKSLEKSKKDIAEAFDKLIVSFDSILDKFYQAKELDIASDISTMEILMKQENLMK